MTITTGTQKVIRQGNDLATSFSFSPIVIYNSTQLQVTLVSSTGVTTLLTEGTSTTNYSVSVSSYPGTGSIA